MFRFVLVIYILCCTILLNAADFNDKNIQIVAKNISTEDTIVTATGHVVLFSQNYYISSEKLIYDKKNGVIEFFGDVNLIRNNEQISFSQYLFIDINKELKKIKPMLMIDNKSQLWFNSTKATAVKSKYRLKNATLSSCDCVNPAWSIGFTRGDYDAQKKWVNTYNTTLYIQDFPVLYTPYFGFSTDKTRKTGLLAPIVGVSNNEGFVYAQPIYYAPQLNYDMEFIPQIRTYRGKGLYYNYRYKDSLYSDLKFTSGVFKERTSYQVKNNLKNDKHYGYNLNYKRSNLFSNNNEKKDGLLVNIINMNDVDYVNTKYNSDTSNYTNKFLESRIKYYYNTNDFYGDLDLKYYNDLSQKNNDMVMQTLPEVDLHKYSNSFLFDNLVYSVDTKVTRETRKKGIGANTTQLIIPVSYNFSFFNDYLNISFSEQMNYTNIDYGNDSNIYNTAHYGSLNHVVSVYTDLVRPFKNFFHAVNLNAIYTKPTVFKKEGSIYNSTTNNDTNLSLFSVLGTQETLSLGFSQSFYNKETAKPIVTHKMNQIYLYNEMTKKYKKGDLENDLRVYFQYGSIANRLFYSYNLKEIVSSVSSLNLNYRNSFLKLYHSYKKDENTLLKDEYITYTVGFDFSKYYNISYMEEYDMVKDISRKKQYLFGIDKKCWGLNLKYVNSLVATNTTTSNAIREDIVYVELNLKQLFNLQQNYKLKQR